MNYCGASHPEIASFCDSCYKKSWCDFPCPDYLQFLSVISECLKGHPFGYDPCEKCTCKEGFDCPIYGPEAENYDQLKLDLPDEIGGYSGNEA